MHAKPIQLEKRIYILSVVSVLQFALLVTLWLFDVSGRNKVAAQARLRC